MTDIRWRNKAKDVLYGYFSNVQRLQEVENDVLLRSRSMRDQRFAKGSIVDNTALGAIALSRKDTEFLRRSVRAVRLLLGKLSTGRRIDRDRMELLKLIYFRAETGVYGAAIRLDISERTAKRWNDQALRFIAQYMGWLQEETAAAPRSGLPRTDSGGRIALPATSALGIPANTGTSPAWMP